MKNKYISLLFFLLFSATVMADGTYCNSELTATCAGYADEAIKFTCIETETNTYEIAIWANFPIKSMSGSIQVIVNGSEYKTLYSDASVTRHISDDKYLITFIFTSTSTPTFQSGEFRMQNEDNYQEYLFIITKQPVWSTDKACLNALLEEAHSDGHDLDEEPISVCDHCIKKTF